MNSEVVWLRSVVRRLLVLVENHHGVHEMVAGQRCPFCVEPEMLMLLREFTAPETVPTPAAGSTSPPLPALPVQDPIRD